MGTLMLMCLGVVMQPQGSVLRACSTPRASAVSDAWLATLEMPRGRTVRPASVTSWEQTVLLGRATVRLVSVPACQMCKARAAISVSPITGRLLAARAVNPATVILLVHLLSSVMSLMVSVVVAPAGEEGTAVNVPPTTMEIRMSNVCHATVTVKDLRRCNVIGGPAHVSVPLVLLVTSVIVVLVVPQAHCHTVFPAENALTTGIPSFRT